MTEIAAVAGSVVLIGLLILRIFEAERVNSVTFRGKPSESLQSPGSKR